MLGMRVVESSAGEADSTHGGATISRSAAPSHLVSGPWNCCSTKTSTIRQTLGSFRQDPVSVATQWATALVVEILTLSARSYSSMVFRWPYHSA